MLRTENAYANRIREFLRNTTSGRIANLPCDMHLLPYRPKELCIQGGLASFVQAWSHRWVGKKCRAFLLARSSPRSMPMLPFNCNSSVPAYVDLAIDNAP